METLATRDASIAMSSSCSFYGKRTNKVLCRDGAVQVDSMNELLFSSVDFIINVKSVMSHGVRDPLRHHINRLETNPTYDTKNIAQRKQNENRDLASML